MPATPGSRIGGYEVVSVLGAGGMGEVYRARDSKLGREVAIKVILDAFAADPDRVLRFQREAKVLASVNHPRIAALYGMEQSDGRHFLVMELVEGETLADRLRRGPLPTSEAIGIALQIAEALDAAHEKGIVHRDLKPANIKITSDDRVKVLDFGLAKAMESDAASANVANSPTLSMMASQAGIVLGTAAYMSPEQAKGFPADHRSDIFAFGSVLYEMLSGRQPFQGDTAPEILASVLVRDADVTRLPADLNPRLVDLVKRCLQKQPKRRWQAIGDVHAELEAIASAPRTSPPVTTAAPPRPLWKRALVPVVCTVGAAAVAASAAWTLKPAAPARVVRFSIELPEGQRFTAGARRYVAISPDGGTIAYVAENRLYLRPLDGLQTTPVPGTQSAGGAAAPSFSPDGRDILFYLRAENLVKRTAVAGGTPAKLFGDTAPAGIEWTTAGVLFGQANSSGRGIMRVSEHGGTPAMVAAVKADEVAEAPQLLPDGDTVLFTVARGSVGVERWDVAQIVAQSLKTGVRKVVHEGGSGGRYLPSGHLLYVRAGTVFAVPFDPVKLVKIGAEVPVLEGVRRAAGGASGVADYSVSDNGTLVYVTGPPVGGVEGLQLVLADRQGATTVLKLQSGPYQTPRASPDGRSIAVGSDDGKDAFVSVYDLSGLRALTRVTFSGKDRYAVWSPDSRRLAYQSGREGDLGIFAQAADGTGEVQRLTRPAPGEAHLPSSWRKTADGEVLLFDAIKGSDVTLQALSMKDGKTAPFGGVRSIALTSPIFSPDGRWVAYSTRDSSGRVDTYVQPYPATGAKAIVPAPSPSAPHHPLWSGDGKELFYVPTQGTLQSVSVIPGPVVTFGNPQPVQRDFLEAAPTSPRVYDMMPDGRFLSTGLSGRSETGSLKQEFTVVLNWFEELKARAPRQR